VRRDLERRLRALEAARSGGIDVWVIIGNGMVRGPLGEEIPREQAEALSHAAGRFAWFISEVDSRL
jgi:hypothetical protein